MSYQVLARKWRPESFSQVVGQSHVLTALANALNHNRLHHAYLLSGTRGVGKTSIARLFAKGLNCEMGVSSTPCGKCQTCREIDEGRFADLIEIDAASRTKVEDTRDILDNVQYKPARGRYKVYIIDEVHMLSRHSFNALLKTLEEPPEYVKFILATTDPQKLPVTVLSRCLQFHLKHLDLDAIQGQLGHVLTSEKIHHEPRALTLIARAADGSMRDALSLADQAIALGNGQVTLATASEMLGTIDTSQALHLLAPIAQGDVAGTMEQLAEIASMGTQWDALLQELSNLFYQLAMTQALPDTLLTNTSDVEQEMIAQLAKQFTAQEIQLCYQISIQSRQDLPLAPDGRVGMEMALLRMLAFRPAAEQVLQPREIVSNPQIDTQNLAVQQTQAVQAQKQQPVVPQVQPEPAEEVLQPEIEAIEQNVFVPQSENPAPVESLVASEAQIQMEQSSVETVEEDIEPQSAASALLKARNRLRSQILAETQGNSDPVKKPSAALKQQSKSQIQAPVSEQLVQKPQSSQVKPQVVQSSVASDPQLPPIMTPEAYDLPPQSDTEEDYQWQATQDYQDILQDQALSQIAPSEIKQDLEHEKTSEMTQQLIHEVNQQDPWAKSISELKLPKLVEQLALNSAYQEEESAEGATHVILTLRANQSHLNTTRAGQALTQALAAKLNKSVNLQVEIGDDGRTPLELREAIYQEKLHSAVEIIAQDPNVELIRQTFDAKVDNDSIRPI